MIKKGYLVGILSLIRDFFKYIGFLKGLIGILLPASLFYLISNHILHFFCKDLFSSIDQAKYEVNQLECIIKIYGFTLFILVFLLMTIVFMLFFLLFITKLKTAFGIFWDKDKNPYCPKCSLPLSQRPFESGFITSVDLTERKIKGSELHCPSCEKTYFIVDDSGIKLTLEEAKKRIKW